MTEETVQAPRRGLSRSNTIEVGGDLVRHTSAVFGGGASVLPAAREEGPTESTPLSRPPVRQLSRQQSRVQAAGQPLNQDQVQQQLMEEVMQFLQRNYCWLILGVILILVLLIVTTVYFVIALIASLQNWDGDCDQPLKWYLFGTFLWGQVPSRLHAFLAENFDAVRENPITSTLIFSALGWVAIIWGVYMIAAADTCPETNPGLYYPLKHYIISQVVFMVVVLFYAVLISLGTRPLLLLINRLIAQPGCEAAVRNFPKVQAGDKELISPEDGQVLACPVCMEELKGAVRTPCGHFFHEDCLATWCTNHLTCPLCRQQLASPDPSEKV